MPEPIDADPEHLAAVVLGVPKKTRYGFEGKRKRQLERRAKKRRGD